MRRHRFRLAQVLRVRQVQEDLAAAALANAQREELSCAATEAARRESAARRRRPSGPLVGAEVLAQRQVWDAELEALRQATEDHTISRAATAHERDGWVRAHQRVRALDKLAERRREEHRVEADRDEARRVDDLVASRHALPERAS